MTHSFSATIFVLSRVRNKFLPFSQIFFFTFTFFVIKINENKKKFQKIFFVIQKKNEKFVENKFFLTLEWSPSFVTVAISKILSTKEGKSPRQRQKTYDSYDMSHVMNHFLYFFYIFLSFFPGDSNKFNYKMDQAATRGLKLYAQ